MMKKLFLFTLLVSSFLVISCSNENTTGSTEEKPIGTGIDLKYAGAVYEALNVQKKNGTVLSVFRITISNEGGYKLFYVEEVSGASYNGETYPNEVLKFSDTKYGNVYSDVTFEFSIDGSTLTLHDPNSYNEDVVLTKK